MINKELLRLQKINVFFTGITASVTLTTALFKISNYYHSKK